MDKFIFRNRVLIFVILSVAGTFLSACSVANKAQLAAVEGIASSIEADTWDELLQNFTNHSLCGAPGAVLLVDSPQGRFLQATGISSVEEQTPMQVSDAFEIGSNTKSFTVALALQLQEEGVWSMDDPLAQWLPEVAAQLPNGDEVTLRQLAGNTSGIWDYANPLMSAAAPDASLRQQAYSPEELIAYTVENGKPDFDPGEGWAYSSTNFVLLGMALESATGQSMAELYQERIFAPLGMNDTVFLEAVPASGQIVQGYYTAKSEDEEETELVNVTDWNTSQGWTAGGIVSTAEDMALYTEGLASGALFEDPDSLVQMKAFKEVDPMTSGLLSAYGLGIGVFPLKAAQGWGHHGQTLGHTTLFMTIPEKDTNVVYLTNSSDCSVALLTEAIKEPLLDGETSAE